VPAPGKPIQLRLASTNQGKLREYQAMAAASGASAEIRLVAEIHALPPFEEAAPTFAENAAAKALHYSRLHPGLILADDSGLVVPALGGAPGVHSARYAGPGASDADRFQKLLGEMRGQTGEERRMRFVCVIALAERGKVRGVFSASCEGELLDAPRGRHGFGYDPVFVLAGLGKTYAEISREEKNRHSHRGKAFRKALDFLLGTA
jgi:XTP/dITP diphosphohydrolase